MCFWTVSYNHNFNHSIKHNYSLWIDRCWTKNRGIYPQNGWFNYNGTPYWKWMIFWGKTRYFWKHPDEAMYTNFHLFWSTFRSPRALDMGGSVGGSDLTCIPKKQGSGLQPCTWGYVYIYIYNMYLMQILMKIHMWLYIYTSIDSPSYKGQTSLQRMHASKKSPKKAIAQWPNMSNTTRAAKMSCRSTASQVNSPHLHLWSWKSLESEDTNANPKKRGEISWKTLANVG